ncbi:hypothetical protein [Flavivirga eckloniae]|uniref:Uncharacterized protein n=1 Tax=Flavivirga eckloniae TaxID=1803846 RepID=A0A2K9PQ93_9FLAO|nr:hypothetical protein [Flavivirga eckloniae]AUP79243.1 hypothetical protein C1H87_11220 [Flavivirga eckloniae]
MQFLSFTNEKKNVTAILMDKTEVFISPNDLVLPPYATITALIGLLNRSGLTDNVVKHCITGLKVIIVIRLDKSYKTGTDLLARKEFDELYDKFPDIYFNNRESIPPIMIIENIHQCIKTDKVIYVDN